MVVYDSATLEDTIENLNEFTTYTFELSANTSVGGGPAAVVMATTDEDGRLITVNEGLIIFFFLILLSTLLKCRVRSEWGVARICHVTL